MIELGRSYSCEEILEHAKQLILEYPGHLQYRPIGVSHQGKELPGIWLGDSEKCLFLTAGIHGRETINPVLLVRMAEEYALIRQNEYRDPGLELWQELLLKYSIYFLPLMNPDGYEIAGKRYEKSAYPQWKENARGVDLNRNFPCASYHRGSAASGAASERETKALIRAFASFPESVGYLDFHSRGELIYYYRNAMPYSYNRKSRKIARRLQRVSGYRLGTRREEHTTRADGGNSVNFYSEVYRKPALTIETVEEDAVFPLDVFYQKSTYPQVRRMALAFLEVLEEKK